MAWEASQPLKDSVEAGADLSALQYHFVKMNNAGKLVPITAITDIPYAVLQNDPTSGQMAEVVIIGITKVVADGTLDEGELIGTSADGQADAIVAGTDTTVYVVGRVRTPGSAGHTVTAVVNCAAPTRAA